MALWSTAFVNDLPDSSFLYVEAGGQKDASAKTVPRTLRHFPYRNTDGAIDLPHLRNALARIPQASLPSDIKTRLTAKAEKLLKGAQSLLEPCVFASALLGDTLTITMYGRIGSYDISAQSVSDALLANPSARQINVRLNSPGGSAFEGNTIRARLSDHPANVTVYVDGLAASAAATIAMAGNQIHMAQGSMMMIHNARTSLDDAGVADLQAAIDLLQGIDAGMRQIYSKRTAKSEAQITAMMDATTWLGAQQAVDFGLADSVVQAAASAEALNWDLSEYKNAPDLLTEKKIQDTGTHMTISAELAKRFNLPETATDADLAAAIDAQLATKPATPDLSKLVADAVAAALAAKTVTAEGVSEIHATSCVVAVERFVALGKIPPDSRERAIKACGSSAASLSAAVAYWEGAPAVVGATPLQQEIKAAVLDETGGSMLAKMVKASGVSQKSVDLVLAQIKGTN